MCHANQHQRRRRPAPWARKKKRCYRGAARKIQARANRGEIPDRWRVEAAPGIGKNLHPVRAARLDVELVRSLVVVGAEPALRQQHLRLKVTLAHVVDRAVWAGGGGGRRRRRRRDGRLVVIGLIVAEDVGGILEARY